MREEVVDGLRHIVRHANELGVYLLWSRAQCDETLHVLLGVTQAKGERHEV